jgi:hypothetical protein
MSIILKYRLFLEKYTIQIGENVSLVDKKNHYNTLEDQIKEYDSQRPGLETIYNTYLDKADLINRLKLGKFIQDTQQQEISYINPLFSSYSSILDLKRKVKDLETFKEKTQKEAQEKKSNQETQPELSKELEDQSKLLSTQLSNKDSEINILKRRISEEETKHQKLITDSKKKLSDLRLQIDNFK